MDCYCYCYLRDVFDWLTGDCLETEKYLVDWWNRERLGGLVVWWTGEWRESCLLAVWWTLIRNGWPQHGQVRLVLGGGGDSCYNARIA